MSRFSAKLLEHFHAPRNAGPLANPTVIGRAAWGSGGPKVEIFLGIAEDRIERIGFSAFGCGATIAACSALTERVKSLPLADAARTTAADIVEELDGLPADKRPSADLVVAALRDGLAQLGTPDARQGGHDGG